MQVPMIACSTPGRRRGMLRPFWLLMLVTLVSAGCRTPDMQSGPEVDVEHARREIERRIADWARWTAEGRIDLIADVFATDAWEADPHMPPIAGRQAILEHWRRAMAMGRWHFEPRVQDIIIRDSIAVERTSYTLRYSAQSGSGGPPSMEDRGSWVNVWRRDEDGKWRILWTIAASELPAAGQ
jgi:ketosteroid isomerase-like protein